MSDAIKLILSMSLSGSALILILLLLKPLLKEGFSKAWQYYIWLIVLLRLLIPYSPEFGLTNDLFHTKLLQTDTLEPMKTDVASIDIISAQGTVIQQEDTEPQTAVQSGGKVRTGIPSLWELAAYLWLAGMLLILAVKILQYIHFTYLIRREAKPVTGSRVLKIYQKTRIKLGLKKSPRLWYSDQVPSPMLSGLVRPTVFLTAAVINMEDDNLSYVLRHELMHYKRHDLWYKWLCEATLSIHWFNPLVHIMSRQINSKCEISCDEALTRDLDRKEKLIYGNMLLNAASDSLKNHRHVLSTTLYEDKKSLKERIISIMTAKRKSKRTIIISVIATILLCTAAFSLGAYTAKGAGKTDKDIEAGSAIDNNSASDNPDTASSDISNNTDTASNSDIADSTDTASNSDIADSTDTASNSDIADSTDTASNSDIADSTDTETVSTQASSEDNSEPELTGIPTPEAETDSIIYNNTEYGFEITLPSSWKGFTVLQEDWQGIACEGEHQGEVVETGTKLSIRHPEWTEENPRQDIPIMIFTPDQWKLIENEAISVSAAPIGPSKLTGNSNYIFALPARYNYAYFTGYEEVEKIIADNFFK